MSLVRHFFHQLIMLSLLSSLLFSSVALAEDLPSGERWGDYEFGTEIKNIPFNRVLDGSAEADRILENYQHLDPQRVIPTKALRLAVLNFHANKNIISNQKFLTIIDFSAHSGRRRFFLVNLVTGATESHHVAHGQGSDPDHDGLADAFSNVNGSLMSSLGFYLTAESYNGKNGYSMRLDGLEASNNLARARAIVVHGADYVDPSFSKMGRSWGCPALAQNINSSYIQKARHGSLILAWVPGL